MTSTINVNKVDTYPELFLNFCSNNKDVLINTFSKENVCLENGSDLFDCMDKLLKNNKFECIHASRIKKKSDIENYGLVNPKKNLNLASIIMSGIKDKIEEKNYNKVLNTLNNLIKNDDKYNTLHFVIGSEGDITISNGFLMLEKYGGELLEDTFSTLKLELEYEKIKVTGIPVAIIFSVKKKMLEEYFLADIYDLMIKKVIFNNNKYFYKSSWIYESISKTDIIEVKELNNYE